MTHLANGHYGGCIPDRYDHRDHIADEAGNLPAFSSVRANTPAVRDQGQEGACTGFGITAAVMSKLKAAGGFAQLSPAYEYFEERVIEGDTNQDAGAMIADGLKVAAKGICPESDMPYVVGRYALAPSPQAVADATYRIARYSRCLTLQSARTAIAKAAVPAGSGAGLVIGILVYPSFEQSPDGDVPMPQRGESILGGHCLYLDEQQVDTSSLSLPGAATKPRWAGGGWFGGQNSWSAGWGAAGFFRIPFAFIASHKLTSDVWAVA